MATSSQDCTEPQRKSDRYLPWVPAGLLLLLCNESGDGPKRGSESLGVAIWPAISQGIVDICSALPPGLILDLPLSRSSDSPLTPRPIFSADNNHDIAPALLPSLLPDKVTEEGSEAREGGEQSRDPTFGPEPHGTSGCSTARGPPAELASACLFAVRCPQPH